MSSDEEQVKKNIALEREQSEEVEARKKAEYAEEVERQLAEGMAPKPHRYRSSSPNNSDWNKIVDNYKQQFPDRAPMNGALAFNSKQEVLDFFQAQAQATPPLKFLSAEITENGKPTGNCVCSVGDGTLYHGTFSQVKAQLQQALQAKPNDPDIISTIAKIDQISQKPTQDFRSALQEGRQKLPKPEQSAPEEEQEQSQTINPLSTRPGMTPGNH